VDYPIHHFHGHPAHRSRKMRVPALRSPSLAIELYWRLASRLRPLTQLNPLPGRVNPQSSVHESSRNFSSRLLRV
jgi:hypothetical protein